jgi:hypothetical protein
MIIIYNILYNTLKLVVRKNIIKMSSDVINYNYKLSFRTFKALTNNLPWLFCFSIPEKQRVQKQAWHNSWIKSSNYW